MQNLYHHIEYIHHTYMHVSDEQQKINKISNQGNILIQKITIQEQQQTMLINTSSLSNIKSFEDPSLSSHLQTIHVQTKNLPKLKYSLACIANSLAYNNSNRHYNIAAVAQPKTFKQIVTLLVHFQDQKILQECLSILNVLLNQGSDLTVQQESDIMHSLSYVNVNNQTDKGFISDKLVQEILFLTYKLKTKQQLSQFVSTLMAEKMTASQAKKFIKELKKQQLKNIQISDLIKIGFKFKTNVLLMNEVLNLIYEKVFSGKDQYETKKLFQFLPKIVQQNIEQQSISYKCLQIYKIIQKQNPKTKLDPLVDRYLSSLLKYKKDLFLPLKRQFVVNEQQFVKILQFGTQFEIYHLLIVDYLIRNGYKGGKQSWRQFLQQNMGSKNMRLKEICLRIQADRDSKYHTKQQLQITQTDERQFLSLLPIQTLLQPNTILQKLLLEPSISNCLFVIKNLCYYSLHEQLLLTIHRISLKQKQFNLVKQIQKIVKQSYSEQFVYQQLKNIYKVKHKVVLKGQLYFIWLPMVSRNQHKLKQLQTELIEIMGYDSIEIQDKFYVMELMIDNRMDKVVKGFLLYLNRQLEVVNPMQENSKQQGEMLFRQIKHYLKHWAISLKSNTNAINFYSTELMFYLERTAQLLFSKLTEFRSETLTAVLFQLQKWGFYADNWRIPYRWLLTALEEINQQKPLFTLDCLELLQMAVQNIHQNSIPQSAKDRFMKIISKNWSRFESQHLFAIQRIVDLLWPNHQFPILSTLKPIKPIPSLISEQQQFNKNNEYFFQSEHPTSLFLQNLQMSHFFGIVSQQQFVKNILLLYDKRFNETKRFTQKNVISVMNFVIWLYQYSEQDMQKGLCDMTMAFLSYKPQTTTNDISSYNIRKKCIEIISVVSHSINLLKLPLKQLIEVYIGQSTVMGYLNEIIQTIIQSKSSYISQLGLETIVESIMIGLVTCEDLELIEEYIDFIQAVCYIEDSPYAAMFEYSLSTLYQTLKAQHKIVQKYRKSLVQFVVDILRHYQYQIQNNILWLLMSKYFVQEQLQVSILQCLVKNLSEEKVNQDSDKVNKKIKLSYDNEKLLVRLIMHHNQHTEIIRMAQWVLENCEKQQLEKINTNIGSSNSSSNKDNSKGDKHATKDSTTQQQKQQKQQQQQQVPSTSPQQQFTQLFSQQLYSSCQQLLPQLRNPFITIPKQEIQLFLKSNQQLCEYENLLNFLIKNPNTRTDLLSTKEFYSTKQSLQEVTTIVQGLRWSEEGLDKLDVKLFNKQKLVIEFQSSPIQLTVKSTISSLLTTPSIKPKLISFLTQLKSTKHQLTILQLYSKCLPQTNNKLLFDIISNLDIEKGLELMRLNMNYQFNNVSEMTCDWLLYHLFVHVEELSFMGIAEMESEKRYIRDVMQIICDNQIEKNITSAHHFFINITKLHQPLPSHKVTKQIVDLANSYLMVFESGQGGFKNKQIKQIECAAILSALLFLLKNDENIHVGVAGKVLQQIGDKLGDNAVLRQVHQHLVNTKPVPKQVIQQQQNSQQKGQLSSQKKKISTLTTSIAQKPQSVVFAKDSPKSQQPQPTDIQQQVSQAFQKGKVLQEYMSVAPRQVKALAEKQKDAQQGTLTKEKTMKLQTAQEQQSTATTTIKAVISVQQSIQQTDSQKLIRPKDQPFDQSSFYDPTPSIPQSPPSTTNDKNRRQLLVSIRSKQNEQISIATLKEHAKFISSLLDYDKLSREQAEELMKSIDNITSTVNQHHYYVKKLVQLEVTFKLIKLYKRKDAILPKDLSKEFGGMFESKLLTLHHAMSYKKEKKTIIFDDQLTIEFFKLIIKKSLAYKKSRNQNIVILEIVSYCIKSIESFFKQGLLSMLIELIKNDINDEDVLKFFCKIQLSKHIIFQIYQRGLLNKFVEVFTRKGNQQSANVTVINRWIKFAGKICTTVAIQQKYVQKQIHKLVWEKHNQILEQDLQGKKSVAFFFACLGKRNQKVFQFMVENGVLEKLLSSLQNENSEQLYTMFYSIGVENANAMDYFFRIKYHMHLIEKLLPKPQHKVKSKFFYKSLGQIMSNKKHQVLFFKEQTIHKLIKQYELKSQPSIYECLLDFIVTLENDKQFEELKRQGFWECLGLFEYKLSSEATYAYILQIFLVMIKKGRIKQFNTPQIRGKVTLKAEYSINLEGKELALRFVTALSIRTKQCYITQRCIRLLSSLVGFKVTSNELDLIEDILDVEGMIDNHQFMEFCSDYEVTQNICVRFKTFNEKQLLSALKILNILGTEAKNNKILREKLFMPAMDMLKQQLSKSNSSVLIQQWLLKLILVIVMYKQSKQPAQRLQFGNFLLEIVDKILTKDPSERKKILDDYVAIVEICRQNSVIPLAELDKILDKLNKSKAQKEVGRISQIKQTLQGDMETQSNQMLKAMTQGTTVKMYKSDGSSSELVLFLTEDKLELNCAIEKGQPIKQKWRLVLSEIYEIQSFEDEKKYESSAFYKSGGLFSRPPDKKLCLTAKTKNNEFNILFTKKEDKERWKKYIQLAVENSKKILKQFK